MALIWEANGEDAGAEPWEFDSIVEDTYGDFALSDVNPQEGTYHYRYTSLCTAEGHNQCRGYGEKGYANQTEIYFVMRIYIPSTFDTINGGAAATYALALLLDGLSGKGGVAFKMSYGNVPEKWSFNDGQQNYESTKNFSTDAYHILQIHILCGAQGKYQSWVDGDHIVTVSRDYSGVELDKILIGQRTLVEIGNGDTLDFDLVLLHDAVIGGYDWPEAVVPPGGLVKTVSGGIIKPKWFGWPK